MNSDSPTHQSPVLNSKAPTNVDENVANPTNQSQQIYSHTEGLIKGFTTITIAGSFIAVIQVNLMNKTLAINADQENTTLTAIDAFYFIGFVLDVLASLLGFLTARWIERLTDKEKELLQSVFSFKNRDSRPSSHMPPTSSSIDPDIEDPVIHLGKQPWENNLAYRLYYTWMGLSLFFPMTLLILGILCMMVGLYIYVWTQHSVLVASLTTAAGAVTLPLIAGDFFIGMDTERRRWLIVRLSEMQGDW